jgi:hypothetical protein
LVQAFSKIHPVCHNYFFPPCILIYHKKRLFVQVKFVPIFVKIVRL